MKNATFLSLAILVIAVLSCKTENTELPEYYFESEFPKRGINLQNVTGETFGIKSFNDTTFYTISFDTKKRWNLISYQKTGDTVFYGKISRFRNMYFLSRKITDTSWRIQALRIKGQLITGFNTMSDQMFLLPFLCEAINDADSADNNDCSMIMKKITPDSTRPYRLIPDKKILKTLYSEFFRFHPEGELMLKTDTLTDMIPQQKSETFLPEELNEEIETTKEESTVSIKLYPNPVKSDLTIEPEDDSRYICEIINTSGTTMQNKTINGKQILNVSELQNGQYYLRVTDNQWNVSTFQFIKVSK